MNALDHAQTAESLMNDNNWEEALTHLDSAITLDKSLGWAFYARGFCKTRCRTDEEALVDLTVACKLMPQFEDAYLQKGLVLSALEKRKEAIQAYSRVIALNPTFGRAYLSRGMEYLQLEIKKYIEAEEDFLTAKGLGEPDVDHWITLVHALKNGDPETSA
jgi:tetratricopeptide (TPR) repeat protein